MKPSVYLTSALAVGMAVLTGCNDPNRTTPATPPTPRTTEMPATPSVPEPVHSPTEDTRASERAVDAAAAASGDTTSLTPIDPTTPTPPPVMDGDRTSPLLDQPTVPTNSEQLPPVDSEQQRRENQQP